MKNLKKFNKGFTLTEIILVLSVAAIIIILSLFVYNKVHNKATGNLLITTLTNINSNIESLFGYGYVPSSTTTLNQAQQDYIFKSEFPDSNADVNDSNSKIFSKSGFTLAYSFTGHMNGYNINELVMDIILPKSICPEIVSDIVSKGDYIVMSSNSKLLASKSNTMPLSNTGITASIDTNMNTSDFVAACNLYADTIGKDQTMIEIYKIF